MPALQEFHHSTLYLIRAETAVSLTTVPFTISLQDIYNKVKFEIAESETKNNS